VRVCDLLGGKTLYSYPDLLGDTLTNDTEWSGPMIVWRELELELLYTLFNQ
jgi:hypothetical protein